MKPDTTTPTLSDAFKARTIPTGPIRKASKGLDGLPLFDPKMKHEVTQEKAQLSFPKED